MSQIYLYILIASLTIASPGPGVLLTLTNTLNYNLRTAFVGILGVAAGMGVISIIAASSLGIIITTSQFALVAVKVIGATYLIYLGVKLFRSTPKQVSEENSIERTLPSKVSRFRQGFFVSLFNPKPIVFFMALFPQFISADKPFFWQFCLLSITFCALVVLIHFIYGISAKTVKNKLATGKAFLYLNKVGGTVFMCFAIGLLTSVIMPYVN
ncbi:LysE family translocator [Dickeya dianthicola]|uniref:LysE family translocator n=2 Tax=Dickeya dianthicola TaxID=204039 RepID=A0ABX9NPU5_9GAMM|nr:LysE family translocator [Dickeya dianthicola]MCI4174537.1 LysE family translocator [Dickeya dianthicola]MCI4181530.1 LysE family translocator [Dickeya dianthicola]MCI4195389.1 LysE family translocator [Dickeya dianthicola]MZG22267.1 LysE family translocator [Dickeya dianthicola]MZG41409.1 LysE family translocator [Dickeya dianthicola]